MNLDEKDQKAFELADEFLKNWAEQINMSATGKDLDYYARPADRSVTLERLYERLLVSATNSTMKPKVIVKPIGSIGQLKGVLCDFDPKSIIGKFGFDSNQVLNGIASQFAILETRNITSRRKGLWSGFCRTILSGAEFLSQFHSAIEFYAWADTYDRDEMSRAALALLLAQEVDGIGFALACDFLKEIGYEQYGKPDSQVRGIFEELGLCDKGISDYKLFRAIVRVAKNNQATPYKVDKWFWLIGSGNFYAHPGLGNEGRVGGRTKAFYDLVKGRLHS